MRYYQGKQVLITGGAGGIGRLMAERIGAQGGALILWDVNAEGLETARSGLAEKGYEVCAFTCDLSDRAAIAEAAERTLAETGRVDILINNAGIVSGRPILEASDEQIQRTFDVNTLALFWTTRAFLPGMEERGEGHVVTIASAGGICGTPRMVDYCSSKFAAVGFDDTLRVELKRQGSRVRTTGVMPFYISTGMFEGVKTRFSFLLPILKPEYVADRVVRAVAAGKRRLIMPRFVYTVYLCRLLPVPVYDWIMDFMGISKSMDEFTGRSGGH